MLLAESNNCCDPCTPSCAVCYQAVDLITGLVIDATVYVVPYSTQTGPNVRVSSAPTSILGQGSYASPATSVCITLASGAGNVAVLALRASGTNPVGVRTLSAVPSGGGSCPTRRNVCVCEVPPGTIYLTSSNASVHSTTFVLQAVPSGWPSGLHGATGYDFAWISTDVWTDTKDVAGGTQSNTGAYVYTLGCVGGSSLCVVQTWPQSQPHGIGPPDPYALQTGPCFSILNGTCGPFGFGGLTGFYAGIALSG